MVDQRRFERVTDACFCDAARCVKGEVIAKKESVNKRSLPAMFDSE